MKIKIVLRGYYLQYVVVRIGNQIFYQSFISKDYPSLQAPCQIAAGPSAWLAQPIHHSLGSDVHINLVCLTYNTSLLSLISK
jgi:hypothetical protein